MTPDIETAILDLALKHGSNKPNAYKVTLDAVQYTLNRLPEKRHVTGHELLQGMRDLALSAFGPMARTVFQEWGIQRTEDFGEIVFQLVEAGLLGKTDADRRSDFARGFDFQEAFERNFDWLDRISGDRGRGA